MSNYLPAPQGKDPHLWELAQKRASFKSHLVIYILVNLFLWALWMFSDRDMDGNGFPWPIWSTIGWGIGLGFHYVGAYVMPRSNSIEREYEKLIDQQNKQ